MQLFFTLMMISVAPAEGLAAQNLALGSAAGTDVGQQLIQVLTSLGVVLALVILLAWLVKRLSGSRTIQTRELRLIGGISLGAKERIVLIQVGDQQLLVGVAPGRLQTLHVLDQPLTSEEGTTHGFTQKMSELLDQGQDREH